MRRQPLLLSIILTGSSAFVVFEGAGTVHGELPDSSAYNPDPSIDWQPFSIRTLYPTDSDYSAIPAATPTSPAPSITTIPPSFAIQTLLDDPSLPTPTSTPDDHEELRKRQAQIQGPAAVLPSNPLQIPPVTTYEIQSGAAKIQVIYTQLFVDIPDQWPSPSAGVIGLGTIQGQVGVVKTKRSEAAQVEARATAAPTNPIVLGRGLIAERAPAGGKGSGGSSSDQSHPDEDEEASATSQQSQNNEGVRMTGALKWSSLGIGVVGVVMFML